MMPNLLRQPLLSLSRSSRVKNAATEFSATRAMVDRFVAGEQVSDAVSTVAALRRDGLKATVDFLGEDITDLGDARVTRGKYLELLRGMHDEGLTADGWAEVSVKLSALGAFMGDEGREYAEAALREICEVAAEVGTTVTVDMEDHTTTDATLAMVSKVRGDFASLGTVLQAGLHRTSDDCVSMSGEGSRIRLCKGAYDEPETVAYPVGLEVDQSYVKCLATLMSRPGYPMVATHDSRLIAIAETLAAHNNRDYVDWEVQMLFGVRSAEQLRLASLGRQVRVYVPFGTDWYGYMVRRLAERPANVTFFLRSLMGSK